MNKNVEELRKVIDQFERDLKKIREATHKEIRRAKAILRKLEEESKPRR